MVSAVQAETRDGSEPTYRTQERRILWPRSSCLAILWGWSFWGVRGADLRYVQALLGHESPDTTSGYLGLVKEEVKEAYDRAVGEVLGT